MLVCLTMGPEGQLFINEGITDEGNLITELPANVMLGLDLFNENRKGFSWEQDADRAAKLLTWLLANEQLAVREPAEFRSYVRKLCVPGPGFDTHGYVVSVEEDHA